MNENQKENSRSSQQKEIGNSAGNRKRSHVDENANTPTTEKWLQAFHSWNPSSNSLQYKKCGESIESQIFKNDSLEWRVILYPRGYDAESRDYFSIFLELSTGPEEYAVETKYSFYLRNEKGELTCRRNSEHLFSRGSTVTGFPRYIKRDSLVDGFKGILCHVLARKLRDSSSSSSSSSDYTPKRSNAILMRQPKRSVSANNRALIFRENKAKSHKQCDERPKMCLMHNQPLDNKVSSQAIAVWKPLESSMDPRLKVSSDLEMHLESDKFSDIILVTANKQFRAHKVILASRSPVFFAMMENNMEEDHPGVVKINDVHDDVFKELLKFVYTGQLSHTDDVTCELLIAAERYAMDDLKHLCEITLSKQLAIENVTNFLILADRHNAGALKLNAIHFINQHAPQIIQSSGYRVIVDAHPHLIEELYRHSHCH